MLALHFRPTHAHDTRLIIWAAGQVINMITILMSSTLTLTLFYSRKASPCKEASLG